MRIIASDGRFTQDVTMEQMIDPCASSPMK